MNAENIIGIVVVAMVSLLMIGIGVSQYRSKKPVGFWTGIEPPKPEMVRDIHAYNTKHGIMWMVYGVCMIGSYVWGLFSQNVFTFLITFSVVVFGGLGIMILLHKRLENRYVIKE